MWIAGQRLHDRRTAFRPQSRAKQRRSLWLAAVAYCARLASVDPNAGSGFELEAVVAVVIGGTSLMGGRGSVDNSLFGVLVISVLETGLAQLGAQEPVKRLVTGGVIVAAVIVDFIEHGEQRGAPHNSSESGFWVQGAWRI